MSKQEDASSISSAQTSARALARAARWEEMFIRAGTHIFTPETVIKRVAPDRISMEVARTRIAHLLGEESKLFYTPAVIKVDERRSTVTFDRVNDFMPLRDLLREDPRVCTQHAARIGESLGYIHKRFPMHNDARDSGPLSDVHGDFNTMNVGLRASDGTVVVLDWSAGRHFEGAPIRDPQLFDVAHFVYSLVAHHHAPWMVGLVLGELVDQFLFGYERQSGRRISRQELRHEVLLISWRLFFRFGGGKPYRVPAYVLMRLASHITLVLSPLHMSTWVQFPICTGVTGAIPIGYVA